MLFAVRTSISRTKGRRGKTQHLFSQVHATCHARQLRQDSILLLAPNPGFSLLIKDNCHLPPRISDESYSLEYLQSRLERQQHEPEVGRRDRQRAFRHLLPPRLMTSKLTCLSMGCTYTEVQ